MCAFSAIFKFEKKTIICEIEDSSPNSCLQAAHNTSIARTTGFIRPREGCMFLVEGNESDSCGNQGVDIRTKHQIFFVEAGPKS